MMSSVPRKRPRRWGALLATLAIAATSLTGVVLASGPATAQTQPVSKVDTTTYDKEVLLVDGKPFYHSGVQFRYEHQRYQKGWTDAELKPILQMIAEDGFNVVNIPIWWSQVEPSKNNFDWTDLEKYIDWCEEYGLKLELLWFSHESTGHSIPMRVPDYAWNDYQLVVDENGDPLQSGDNFLFDKTDPNLLEREKFVLGEVMDHLAAYDTAHTTVGMQVTNEPNVAQLQWGVSSDRSYSDYSNALWNDGGYTDAAQFRRDVLLDYLTELGQVVKDSDYPIYTRVNTVGDARPVAENEQLRAQGQNTIDFIGYDPYTTNIDTFYDYGRTSTWAQGQNLPMVMETFAGSGNAHVMKFNSIAGGAVHNLYAATDGYSDTGSSNFGLYDFDPDTHEVTRKQVSYEIRDLNHTINKISVDLATKAPVEAGGSHLQTYNRTASASVDVTKPLADVNVNYATSTGGQGIAVQRSATEFALISIDNGGTYSFPEEYGDVSSVEVGFYDANDDWVSEGSRSHDVSGGNIDITVNEGEAVRVVFANTDPSTTTEIVARHSDKCLDVVSASTDNGADAIQWDCHGGDNQQWRLENAGDGYFQIVASHSGKCLDVVDASTDNNARIEQWGCSDGLHQQWELRDTGDGYVEIVARHSGKCLDVVSASTDDGARLQQYDCWDGTNQHWSL
ncbi:RICIN domain-containing protein [Glycomyces sp. L485]|uniref:RICIN domain-containing protein n=1 Tax=Glycomyces sp. L485 TaxID=2909235 RepID=UPI001F4B815C|nr:RICIN domain-containing protein [Glycomyces sp. L485]MCH7231094.1 RICIN domain-containing protein [Glycomyces sp. L485]